MLQKQFDGVSFYCPRPRYKLTNLDASICKKGISQSTKALFNRRPAKVIVDEIGRIWLSDFVSPDELYTKVIEEPEWFVALYQTRSSTFSRLKQGYNPIASLLLENSLDANRLLMSLDKLVELQTTFLSYVYLPLIDELLVQKFQDIAREFLPEEVINEYVFEVLKPPSYFREAIDSKIVFDENKTLVVPPTEKPFLLKGQIELGEDVVSFDSTVLSQFPRRIVDGKSEEIRYFSMLRALVPIFFQIGQEDFFIGKALIIALSNCIYGIAKILERDNKIRGTESILEHTIDEIRSMMNP